MRASSSNIPAMAVEWLAASTRRAATGGAARGGCGTSSGSGTGSRCSARFSTSSVRSGSSSHVAASSRRSLHSSSLRAAPAASNSRAAASPSPAGSGSSSAASASSNSATPSYPFAPKAIVRTTDVAPTPNMSVKRPNSRGIMATVLAQLRQERDPSARLTGLFARSSPNRIPVGSVLVVETYTSAARTGVSTFSGILLAVRRRGMSTSFIVRNIVSKTGVEIMFNLYSPLLKDVRVVQRALAGKDDRSGRLRRARRAKLYYLRHDNRKLASIGKSIAAHRSQLEAERAKKAGAPNTRR